MRLFVTGGAGFIGSAVIRQAIKRGYDVLNVDCLTYASCLDNLKSVDESPYYSFIKKDICDLVSMKKAMTDFNPDAVIHLAAESHVDRSIDNPYPFLRTNIEGTFSMLEAARQYMQTRKNSSWFRFFACVDR